MSGMQMTAIVLPHLADRRFLQVIPVESGQANPPHAPQPPNPPSERSVTPANQCSWSFSISSVSLRWSRGSTKRCRLSWLTNSALVYKPKCGGEGGGGGGPGSQPMSTACAQRA
jgi:hypothetical protein